MSSREACDWCAKGEEAYPHVLHLEFQGLVVIRHEVERLGSERVKAHLGSTCLQWESMVW